jgi:diadenosine tetraphosphatase ApaH/serine/threonine PP2A family protein phosphatase
MPVDGDPRACFALWEDGEVRLERLAYNIESAIERLRSSGLPQEVAAKMAEVLRKASRNA